MPGLVRASTAYFFASPQQARRGWPGDEGVYARRSLSSGRLKAGPVGGLCPAMTAGRHDQHRLQRRTPKYNPAISSYAAPEPAYNGAEGFPRTSLPRAGS
jgi:hypothetical protein